jgi:hypothetical protein
MSSQNAAALVQLLITDEQKRREFGVALQQGASQGAVTFASQEGLDCTTEELAHAYIAWASAAPRGPSREDLDDIRHAAAPYTPSYGLTYGPFYGYPTSKNPE